MESLIHATSMSFEAKGTKEAMSCRFQPAVSRLPSAACPYVPSRQRDKVFGAMSRCSGAWPKAIEGVSQWSLLAFGQPAPSVGVRPHGWRPGVPFSTASFASLQRQ